MLIGITWHYVEPLKFCPQILPVQLSLKYANATDAPCRLFRAKRENMFVCFVAPCIMPS